MPLDPLNLTQKPDSQLANQQNGLDISKKKEAQAGDGKPACR